MRSPTRRRKRTRSSTLRWFIDHEQTPDGAGPDDLADYCHQISTYWDARQAPNVHLFHYTDMWNDLDGEMRRVSTSSELPVDERRWPEFVDAARLKSMRAKADVASPEAEYDLWQSPEQFFPCGWDERLGFVPDLRGHRLLRGATAGARRRYGRGACGRWADRSRACLIVVPGDLQRSADEARLERRPRTPSHLHRSRLHGKEGGGRGSRDRPGSTPRATDTHGAVGTAAFTRSWKSSIAAKSRHARSHTPVSVEAGEEAGALVAR
jgi:hypothetical protein